MDSSLSLSGGAKIEPLRSRRPGSLRVRGKNASGPGNDLIGQLYELQAVNDPRKLEIELLDLAQRLRVTVFIEIGLAGVVPDVDSTGLHKMPEPDVRLEDLRPRRVAQETAMQVLIELGHRLCSLAQSQEQPVIGRFHQGAGSHREGAPTLKHCGAMANQFPPPQRFRHRGYDREMRLDQVDGRVVLSPKSVDPGRVDLGKGSECVVHCFQVTPTAASLREL